MSGRVVYWNGDFIPEGKARLSIYDSACLFGDCVFEMTRSFNGKQFRLEEHLRRLYNSAKYVHINIPLIMEQMLTAIEKTIAANAPVFEPDDEHRLMINITRGILGIYQGVVGVQPGPNVIIADFPLRWTVRGMGKLFDVGINAVIPSQRAIPATLLEPKVKSRSRLHLMMANIQASQMQGENNWALLLDPDGFIAEGTGDNFFIIKQGTLYTPEPRNILRGISREYMRRLAHACRMPYVERNIEPYDVLEADEAFMTGTPFCVLPVVSLNGTPIGRGKPGGLTGCLLSEWGHRVGVDIKKQIQAWDAAMAGDIVGSSPYQFKEQK